MRLGFVEVKIYEQERDLKPIKQINYDKVN